MCKYIKWESKYKINIRGKNYYEFFLSLFSLQLPLLNNRYFLFVEEINLLFFNKINFSGSNKSCKSYKHLTNVLTQV